MIENESGDIVAVDNSNEVAEVVEQEAQAEAPLAGENPENKTEGEVKRKRPSGFHRKISRLEQQLADVTARLAEKETPSSNDAEPQIDNFPTWDAYNSALITHRTNKGIAEALEKRDQSNKKIQEAKQKETENQTWQEKIDSLPEEYDDYEEVVGGAFNNVALSQVVIEAAKEAGPEVIYKIANDKQLTEKIKSMTAAQAIKEIIRIESELSKPSVRVSKSSEPITPSRGTTRTSIDLTKLNGDDYGRQRYPHLYK